MSLKEFKDLESIVYYQCFQMPQRICTDPLCQNKAIYQSLNKDVPTHCKEHKLVNQYNTKYKKCGEADCVRMACWGQNDQFQRCGEHKLPEDSNRANKNKVCKEPGCVAFASFGSCKNKPQFCASHKKDGMWGVGQASCNAIDCKIRAAYGFEKGKPYFCYLHKTNKEIYVLKKPSCVYDSCQTIPIYGLQDGDAIYCKSHIPQDGNTYTDVKHKTCLENNCPKRPTFGIEWGVPLYCVDHKHQEHFDVVNKRCEIEGCNKYPQYGIGKGIALRCILHKDEDDIQVFADTKREQYERVKHTKEFKNGRRIQYEKHKDKILANTKKYYNNNYIKKLLQAAQKRSIKKEFKFDLTYELLVNLRNEQEGLCIYCKCTLQTTGNIGKRQSNVISIDRIDSSKGYTVDNVQLTCMFCNYAKNRWSDNEYKIFIECLTNGCNQICLTDSSFNTTVSWKKKCLSGKGDDLSIEWFDKQLSKQNWKCYYSGLHLIPKQGKPYIFQPSIERLDNANPHTQENCVIVCLPLNFGRCSTELGMFLSHLENIKMRR
jgi:hypothetical protein